MLECWENLRVPLDFIVEVRMGKQRQANVTFTPKAWEVLIRARNAHGLKGAVSAALICFSRLDPGAQIELVAEVQREDEVWRKTQKRVAQDHKAAQAASAKRRSSSRRVPREEAG